MKLDQFLKILEEKNKEIAQLKASLAAAMERIAGEGTRRHKLISRCYSRQRAGRRRR